ncbi:MAG: HNH endonuclease [Verrucomicrobia bacterium]|nr:HNH endonuclease [Deltaproteobacteria bacterium]
MDIPRQGCLLEMTMAIPSAEEQLKFLSNIQRILDEGSFVATYKFALILSLADYAVKYGNDDGEPIHLTSRDIAEGFIQYYWRQAIPFAHGDACSGLKHSTGSQPFVFRRIGELHLAFNGSLSTARRNILLWDALIKDVASTIAKMPLWKLQVVGRSPLSFLYLQHGAGNHIDLLPGVVYNFRRFYDLIRNLVQGAWTGHVRRINRNILGEADLADFLFGAERTVQPGLRTLLRDIQSDNCFYCDRPLREAGEIDHFVPWARYPIDLGHNFVLAHATCNRSKRDFLAAQHHLQHWQRRNQDRGAFLSQEFDSCGIIHNIKATERIAFWAYSQAESSQSNLWHQNNTVQQIEGSWRQILEGRVEAP